MRSGHRTGAVLETRNGVSVHEDGVVTERERQVYAIETHGIEPLEFAREVRRASIELFREML